MRMCFVCHIIWYRAQYETSEFSLTAPAPEIVEARFIGACAVVVDFDDTISQVDACSDALDSDSMDLLGTGNNAVDQFSQVFLLHYFKKHYFIVNLLWTTYKMYKIRFQRKTHKEGEFTTYNYTSIGCVQGNRHKIGHRIMMSWKSNVVPMQHWLKIWVYNLHIQYVGNSYDITRSCDQSITKTSK